MAAVPPTLVGPVSSGRNPVNAPGNVITIAHTVPDGTDILLVYVGWDTFFFGPTNRPVVTWQGTTLEVLHQPATSNTPRATLYGLIAPAPGSGDIVVTCSPTNGTTSAAIVYNVAGYGGIRFAEYAWAFNFDANANLAQTRIYSDPTDLVIDMPGWDGVSGVTVTPAAGQTVLASDSGLAGDTGCKLASSRIDAPVATGNPTVPGNYTQAEWTLSSNSGWTHYLLAIKGIDRDPPPGVPYAIGRLTETMTLEQQPSTGIAVADNPWRWRHEIPSTHRFLAVLVTYFNTAVSQVFYQPDGGAEIALTQFLQSNSAGAWFLADAPVGLGYVRVVLTGTRWYGAAAYSLATDAIETAATRTSGSIPIVTIPTTPGAIVVDRTGELSIDLQNWTAAAPQVSQYCQAIYGALNVRTATTGSNSGAGSWRTATDPTTLMTWTADPAVGTSSQIAISFLGGEPECPGTRGDPPIDGLPYTPPVFPPCAGSGQRGDPPIGV